MKTFIVGSGRSGTLTASEVCGLYTSSAHEHKCTEVERLGTLRHYGRVSSPEIVAKLREWYADTDVHVNNKLSWVYPELREAFPDATFILLVRDGRKVVSSYLHKLDNEAYTALGIQAQLDLRRGRGEPPIEKGYWYPVPAQYHRSSVAEINRLEILSWYWGYANLLVLGHSPNIQVFKLEVIGSSEAALGRFVRVATGKDVDSRAIEFVKRPHNAIIPKDFGMSSEEQDIFFGSGCASLAMDMLGYSKEEFYAVKY